MIKVRISEEAFEDLQDGFLFYEAQEPGLGEYFAASLRADIEGLKVTGGIHRLLGRVFPYAIFYTFGNQEVTIWAVIDCRRDPEWIRKHLDA